MSRQSEQELDERVWELLEQHRTPREVAVILDIPQSHATRIAVRLRRARGYPNIDALGEAIEQLRAIRF